jgi:hypothetical protein
MSAFIFAVREASVSGCGAGAGSARGVKTVAGSAALVAATVPMNQLLVEPFGTSE